MALIYNEILCTTIEELDALIIGLSEYQKQIIRNDFNGVSNQGLATIPLKVKIYDYLSNTPLANKSEPPLRVDFVTGLDIKLYRKSILIKGECIREEFYQIASVDATTGAITYSNLIVKEEINYVRNSLGFPVTKNSVISYALENGSFHTTVKNIAKVYSSLEQIDEGKTRRGNLVDGLQMPCIGLIAYATNGNFNATPAIILEGRRFLSNYKNEFDNFVAASDKSILDCLTNTNNSKYILSSNYTWIDSMTPYQITIRQYLINELTI